MIGQPSRMVTQELTVQVPSMVASFPYVFSWDIPRRIVVHSTWDIPSTTRARSSEHRRHGTATGKDHSMATPTTRKKQLGYALKYLRERAGLSQEQAGGHIGKRPNRLAEYESGQRI